LGVAAGTGDNLYADKTGHPTIKPNEAEDASVLSSRFPKLYGGFNNTITYNDIQLDFFFQFVNSSGYNDPAFWNGTVNPGMFAAGNSNQPVTVLDHWQKPGDENKTVAKFSTIRDPYVTGSDHRDTNISLLSLKNVSLSWALPQKWTSKAKFKSFRLYMHAQNLFTLSKYKGLNPETQSLWSLPPLQVWTLGIQAGL
jgi:hypothetical protein